MRGTSFAEKVCSVVRGIPAGSTLTYGEVACRAGNSRAARAVGATMRANFDPGVPCHRVIRADGSPGGYNRGGPRAKSRLLASESGKVNLRRNRRRASMAG
ncbi:MAG TPA: MGMT family protein [Candidatus Paceibacterota bacterium]